MAENKENSEDECGLWTSFSVVFFVAQAILAVIAVVFLFYMLHDITNLDKQLKGKLDHWKKELEELRPDSRPTPDKDNELQDWMFEMYTRDLDEEEASFADGFFGEFIAAQVEVLAGYCKTNESEPCAEG
ncbi:hypothetical protein ScPMuIL_002898 [Solemya velum]